MKTPRRPSAVNAKPNKSKSATAGAKKPAQTESHAYNWRSREGLKRGKC